MNPTGEIISGRRVTAGDRLDKFLDVIHAEDLQRVRSEAQKFPHGGLDMECRIVRPDESVRRVHVRTFQITDSKENVCRIAGIMEDITDARSQTGS